MNQDKLATKDCAILLIDCSTPMFEEFDASASDGKSLIFAIVLQIRKPYLPLLLLYLYLLSTLLQNAGLPTPSTATQCEPPRNETVWPTCTRLHLASFSSLRMWFFFLIFPSSLLLLEQNHYITGSELAKSFFGRCISSGTAALYERFLQTNSDLLGVVFYGSVRSRRPFPPLFSMITSTH